MKIAVMPGDGVGKEVIPQGLRVLQCAAREFGFTYETTDYPFGAEHYLETGITLPDSALKEIGAHDAILFGAVGADPRGNAQIPQGLIETDILLKMRFELDQYINLRPFLYPENNVDMMVVRENTEGTYAGEGGFLRKNTPYEIATQGSVNTRKGAERAIRYAFDLAQGRERKHLTLVHKTNVLTFAGDLWQRAFDEAAADYPDVDTAYHHVDAACIYFVQDPGRYDVIVTDNLFGDILTDLGGAVSGGIGRAASGNLNPARTGPSLFEPVHGSAPDIAGTGKADPRAAVISAAMMLEFLGEDAAGARVRAAVDKSDDVQGTTAEIGDAIAGRI